MQPMNVGQLIAKLQEFDQSLLVVMPQSADDDMKDYMPIYDVFQLCVYDTDKGKDIDAVAIKPYRNE